MYESLKRKLEAYNYSRCIARNEQIARERYGSLLTEDRRVEGTDIWFDEGWRMHVGDKEKGGMTRVLRSR